MSGRVGIIGGGVVGLCAAYYLTHAGRSVTIFDPVAASPDGCSAGNAGMVVPSHVVPLAQPGMIQRGLRWMLRADSPFYVRPRLDLDLLRWGWLFYKNATSEHVARSVPVLRDLSLLSKELYQQLATELDFGWQERGLLMLYKTAAAEQDMAEEADVANRAGVEARILNAAEVQALEPETPVNVRGAVFYPGDAHLNPGQFIQALRSWLEMAGATFVAEDVAGFATSGRSVTALRSESGIHAVDDVVLAAGAWSPELSRQLGLRLPLQGGKGYSFMLNNMAPSVRIPAILLEARATVTPVGAGLRFAGTLEIAGTDRSVNRHRVAAIAQAIGQYYPDLNVPAPAPETVWRGLRPCSPDGLPYIGRLAGWNNVALATGHGMMGLSLGPATGLLVAEVLTGQETRLDVAPFAPGRFNP